MRFSFKFLILISEAVAQKCTTSSECPTSAFGICGENGNCRACNTNKDCRELTQGDRRKNLGLYFCDKPTGKCQGIFGDDDITGYGNNPEKAILGTTNDVAIQNCPATKTLKPNEAPSVRTVSNAVHYRLQGEEGFHMQYCDVGRVANSLAVFFGQFVDHDITLFGEKHGAHTEGLGHEDLDRIFLPKNTFENGQPTVEITSFIDLSAIYGSHPDRLDKIRAKPDEVCSTLELDVCEPDCAKSEDGTKCVAKPTCDATKKCDETLCYLDGDTCTPIPGLNGVNGLLRWNNKKDDGKREMLPVPDAEAEMLK